MDFSKNPPDGIGQSLNVTYELRSLKEKKSFWINDQLCFYAKKSFFSEKCPKIDVRAFFEQIPVTHYCPKMENLR